MNKDEATKILNSDTFKGAVRMVHEDYLVQLKNNPTNATEYAIALRTIDDILTALESYMLDDKLAEYNQEQMKRYQ